MTVDYYDIEIKDAIDVFGGGLSPTIDACRQNLSLDNPFCQPLTTRGPDGQLRDVPLFNANIANIKTSGIDFNVNYPFDLAGADYGDHVELAGRIGAQPPPRRPPPHRAGGALRGGRRGQLLSGRRWAPRRRG